MFNPASKKEKYAVQMAFANVENVNALKLSFTSITERTARGHVGGYKDEKHSCSVRVSGLYTTILLSRLEFSPLGGVGLVGASHHLIFGSPPTTSTPLINFTPPDPQISPKSHQYFANF